MTPPFSAPTLRLTVDQYRTLVGHCYDPDGHEACGLLGGPMRNGEPTGVIGRVYPCRNTDASALSFTVDGRDYLRASRDVETRGEEIVGVWHSHTHSDPYPSPTDIDRAADPAWLYVIVSLRDGAPTLRAYRIRSGAVAEVPVELGS